MLITDDNAMRGTIYDDVNTMALRLKIGDCLTFGSFVPIMDSLVPKIRIPMLWHVIDKKENKLKLLSYFFFDNTGYWTKQYGMKDVTWENTSVRDMLNNKCFYDCFNESEREAILTTEVRTKVNDSSYIVTKDKLYVPALEDIENIAEHLKIGRCLETMVSDDGIPAMELLYCFYWLRDPGEFENTNLAVRGYADGKLFLDSLRYDGDEVGVRAVMWIDAEKIK